MEILNKKNININKSPRFKKIERVYSKTAIACLFVGLTINSISANAELVHPGGWHTQEDLTLIRTKIADKQAPWITGWDAVKNESPDAGFSTNPSALITSNGAMHTAGMSAWVLTMKWVATGDRSYSDAAIDIIDTWVKVVRDFDVYGPTLTVSTGAGAMAQAAEILEHGFNGEAGWSQDSADAAKAWFKEIIYDKWTNIGDYRSTNWGTSALGGNMSMAIFMDDEDEYDYQVNAYKFGYSDTDDGCTALTDYIFDDSGQAQESGRDQAHVQGGIAHLTEAALSMWNQGDDLVYRENNRLLAGVEYHARYGLGYDDLPFTTDIYNPCDLPLISKWDDAISEEYRGEFSPVYYMSAKLFSKAGLEHPNTKAVLTHDGYSPEENNFAHPGLGTFAFVSTENDATTTSTTPTTNETVVVHITKSNASDFAIDGNWGADNYQGIYLWDENENNVNQQWLEINRGDGYYSYQKSGTDYCIDGGKGGAKRQAVYLYRCSDDNQNQHWEKIAASGGTYRLQKRNSPDYSLDGSNGGENGQAVYLWTSNTSTKNQRWFITPQ